MDHYRGLYASVQLDHASSQTESMPRHATPCHAMPCDNVISRCKRCLIGASWTHGMPWVHSSPRDSDQPSRILYACPVPIKVPVHGTAMPPNCHQHLVESGQQFLYVLPSVQQCAMRVPKPQPRCRCRCFPQEPMIYQRTHQTLHRQQPALELCAPTA